MFITDENGKVYLHNITEAESKTIGKLRQSLSVHKTNIILLRVVGKQQVEKAFMSLLENDPSQIAVSGFRFIMSPAVVQVQPVYTYSAAQDQMLIQNCKKERDKIIQHIQTKGDEYSTVQRLHDILSRNIKYVAGENSDLHSIVGPLTKKIGVCEGFAKTLKFLLDELSIPSIVVTGRGFNQLTQQEEPHAWNIVQIDGEWTHIDLTFNTTIREHGVTRYDYFGLSNEEILKDHKYDVSSYPEAKSKGLSYYERHGLVMRKKSNLNAFLMASLQAGKKEVVFKLPDTASDTNVDVQVASEINSFLSQNNLFIRYILYYNAKQKIFHVHLEN